MTIQTKLHTLKTKNLFHKLKIFHIKRGHKSQFITLKSVEITMREKCIPLLKVEVDKVDRRRGERGRSLCTGWCVGPTKSWWSADLRWSSRQDDGDWPNPDRSAGRWFPDEEQKVVRKGQTQAGRRLHDEERQGCRTGLVAGMMAPLWGTVRHQEGRTELVG